MYIRTGSLAMMEAGGTLFTLYYLFTSPAYRTRVIAKIKDTVLKDFFEKYDALKDKDQTDRTQSVANRLVPLITDERVRRVIGQKNTLRLADNSIVLMPLPRSKKSEVLAGLFLSRYSGRVFIDYPKVHTGSSVPVIGTATLSQLPESVRDKMLSEADFITYRLTAADSRILKDQLDPYEQDDPASLLPGCALLRPGPRESVSVELRQYPTFPESDEAVRKFARSQYHTRKEKIDERHAAFIEHLDHSPKLSARSRKNEVVGEAREWSGFSSRRSSRSQS
jgi:hypothetical protein